jgi:hypothetical protein
MVHGVNKIISSILTIKHGITALPETPKPKEAGSKTPTWELPYTTSSLSLNNEKIEWSENDESNIKEENHEQYD